MRRHSAVLSSSVLYRPSPVLARWLRVARDRSGLVARAAVVVWRLALDEIAPGPDASRLDELQPEVLIPAAELDQLANLRGRSRVSLVLWWRAT